MNPVINMRKIVLVFLFSAIFLFLFQDMKIGISSNGDSPENFNTEFEMTEFSITTGFYSGSNTVDLELPSSEWNVNEIELNFTNLQFGQEVNTIENIPTDSFIIDKFHDGYGVQIVIHNPTTIYGVEIFGNNESTENKPIYIQISGNNNNTNSPNNTIYGIPLLLNMSYSLTPSWHIQSFSTPINLVQGTYYLVMNATAIGTSPKSDYYWYYNDINPFYSELNISELNAGSWGPGIQGTPLLYKLIQKVNDPFFPEDVNMTAEFNGNFYQISNTGELGKGYFKKSNLNYKPNSKNIKIKIKNNKTERIDFGLNYKLNINNDFIAPTKVEIKNNSMNVWRVLPSIERFSNNDSIRFDYPSSWSNISVWKNKQELYSDVIIDSLNNLIIISNNTIENGAEWEIRAYSPNIHFVLNYPKTDWIGGQELYFSIKEPILEGSYNFILRDHARIQINEQQKINLPIDTNKFTYLVPPDISEGNYSACIYWYNQTDAGFQSVIFSLYPKPVVNTSPIYLILGICVVGGAAIAGSSYFAVKKVQSKRKVKAKQIIDKCSDIMNLEYIIVLDKKSGIDVYSETYTEKEVDATLISGFLQAIQNFGSEVLDRARESRTFKVEYRKSIIIMSEFVNLRLIVIMRENPSKKFLYSIEDLVYEIYHKYGNLFDEFSGSLAAFQGIKDLLDIHLGTSFAYPHVIDYSLKVKLSQPEKELVKSASDFMKNNNLKYFYMRQLFAGNICSPKDYETIIQLILKGIFKPIDIYTD